MRARLIRALAFLRVARPVHTSRMPQIDVHIRSLPTCATLPGTIAPGRPGRFVRWLALESISTLRMMSTLSQLLALSLLPQASVALTTRVEVPCFEASAWPEADLIFRRDRHWVGGDGASSVDLGGGRTLWLFGDSWIDPSGKHTRQGARMISNSVAIQTGTDPATAAIAFYWGRAKDGGPAPLFPDRGAERLWPGSGVRLGNRLVLFFNRIKSDNGSGFDSAGWTAVMVENVDAAPSAWRVMPLETPDNPLGVIVGFAGVLQLDEYVYAFGSEDPVKSHPLYLVRWPSVDVRRGKLLSPEWWAGDRMGWVADISSVRRWPVLENGQSELTIHFDQASNRFLELQAVGFGAADVAMRAAPSFTGPWTAPQVIYRPPEYNRPNVMIYSAKGHPQLTGTDMLVTYSTNSFQFAEHLTDSQIYYPRFVRLTRCK